TESTTLRVFHTANLNTELVSWSLTPVSFSALQAAIQSQRPTCHLHSDPAPQHSGACGRGYTERLTDASSCLSYVNRKCTVAPCQVSIWPPVCKSIPFCRRPFLERRLGGTARQDACQESNLR